MSLGVDPVAYKTCTLDCIYCECGATTFETIERKEYVPGSSLISELDRFLEPAPSLDYITFAGSGEPTLNTALGTVVRHLKARYPQYRTALLTNTTLFHLPEVRRDAALFDLVLPSLDAASEDAFRKVNRPAAGLSAETMIEGLATFAQEYRGTLWVEVFIAPGINDTPDELTLLKEALTRIAPTRVQLNSLDRPGTCSWLKPADPLVLSRIAERFRPLPVEIISRARPGAPQGAEAADLAGMITALLARRPCTIEDLAVSSGSEIGRIRSVVDELLQCGKVERTMLTGREFFRPT